MFFHSQREGVLRLGRSAVLTAFARVCFQAVVDHIHHRLTSRGVSVYKLQSFRREAKAPDVEPRGQRPKLQVGSYSSGRGASTHASPACHDQTAGITLQLSPRRALGGVSGLTWHARKSFLVDENGTESVDAQISVTASVNASGYENVSRLDPTLFLGRAFGVLFRLPACGCRFGSGPGRLWFGVCRSWFCPWFRSVSVGSSSKKKRAPTQKPAVICDHFTSGFPIPSCSMFWDFSSLHQKHRASAGHLVVYFVTGLMVGDRRVPGATILGSEVLYFFRQPSRVSPADWFRTS